MSKAGKEVLIKAIVQAIPTFAMSCFKLPIGLCKDFETMVRKFWRGIPRDRKGICWKSWDILCRLRNLGVWVLEILRFLTSYASQAILENSLS